MAVVQGIREKVHHPVYDSISVEPEKQLRDIESSSTLKFFINVQGKTKLQTNLQSASLLPHYNTFEARAMRVVISDLPPEYSTVTKVSDTGVSLSKAYADDGTIPPTPPATPVTADIDLSLERAMKLLAEAQKADDGLTTLDVDDEDVTLKDSGGVTLTNTALQNIISDGGTVELSADQIEDIIKKLDRKAPPKEQLHPNSGAGSIIAKLVYTSVTTFYVGEKIMIQMPTWFFPAGGGPASQADRLTTHGEPSPAATFRFAEPIFIDKQQNFRVEIEVPDADVLKEIQKIYGPLYIWVVLDGYMTRGVQ